MKSKAKFGDTVTVHFTCKLDDGSLVESSDGREPLKITIGTSGFMKSFERAFIGLEPGETKSFIISADQAYGPYKEELRQILNREQFPADLEPEVGMQIKVKADNNEQEEQVIRVVEVMESSVILDANHYLAGKDLFFDIKLVDITKHGPSAHTHFALGSMLQEKGFLEEAVQHYLDANEIDPDFADAHFNLGVLYQIFGRIDDAMSHYRKVLELKADHMEAMINLGNILRMKGKFDDAIAYFHQALAIKPDYASIYNNMGAVFKDQGDLENAINNYKKSLELDDTFAEAHNNLGMALQENAQFAGAENSFRKAIQANPELAEAHCNLASVLLLSGKLEKGWEEYEWRLRLPGSRYVQYQYPVWDGSSLEGKTLLIVAEEHIEDEIMFASCLPDIIAKAAVCFIECDPRIAQLVSRSFPKAICFERGRQYLPDLSSVQLKTTLGSLPKYLRANVNSFPDSNYYLLPDISRVRFWQDQVQKLGKGLKIGISWRDGQHAFTRGMTSPSLEQWNLLLSVPGASFISLQSGDVHAELEKIKDTLGITIHSWADLNPIENLDELAAQIAALDLVVSLDNVIAHLAGAIGRPVWTLLPYVPEWRWMLAREDSSWYPPMRLFRQPEPGDWKSVMERVAEELKKFDAK